MFSRIPNLDWFIRVLQELKKASPRNLPHVQVTVHIKIQELKYHPISVLFISE